MALGGVWSKLVSGIFGFGIGGAMARTIEPVFQDLTNQVWSEHPSRPLEATDAASAAARLRIDRGTAEADARMTGIDGARFEALRKLSLAPPAAGELIELLRRNAIDAGAVVTALRQGGMDETWTDDFLRLRRVHLDAATLASGRLQGFIDPGEQHARSRLVGVEPDDADLLWEIAGLPPGVETGLVLLRRGVIDEGRFAQIVREGHTKSKYTDNLLALRRVPLSAATAAEAVLRERMSFAQGAAIAAQNGVPEDEFRHLVDVNGRPPGIMEALSLVNRRVMTKENFREVVARSDVRTEYTDDLFHLKEHFPSLFQIRLLVQNAGIDDKTALDLLVRQGYDHDLAVQIVSAAHNRKTAKHRELAESQILELHAAGFEPEQWARERLGELGYTAEESTWILLLNEAQRLIATLKAALARIHSRYVAHDIDEGQAVAAIDSLGIAAEGRNRMLELRGIEREANVRRLTEAQTTRALQKGLIAAPDATDRLVHMGYPLDDARILVAIALTAGNPGVPH